MSSLFRSALFAGTLLVLAGCSATTEPALAVSASEQSSSTSVTTEPARQASTPVESTSTTVTTEPAPPESTLLESTNTTVTATPVESGGPVPSALQALPSSESGEFDKDEQYLVSLLIGPDAIPGEHRLHVVQADDPNGGATIGEYWYPPRLLTDDCSIRTDQAPIPLASAAFVPGSPKLSTSDDPFAMLDADYQVGVNVLLFDNSEQRDAFGAIMEEFVAALNSPDCALLEEFSAESVEVESVDVGYPAYSVHSTQGLFGAESYSHQYRVGDRVLLTATMATTFGEDVGELDPEILETVVRNQVTKLQAAGLG